MPCLVQDGGRLKSNSLSTLNTCLSAVRGQAHTHVYARTHTHAHTHTHMLHPGWGRTWALEPCELSPAQHPAPILTCDVVHHHGHRGVPDIAGDQAAEPLLAGCVPELQPHLSQGGQEVQGMVRSSGWERGAGGSSAVLALPGLGRYGLLVVPSTGPR